MQVRSPFIAAFVMVILVAGSALAQAPRADGAPPDGRPDAATGGVLAQRWCASCHIVSSRQTSGQSDAPPFSSLARNPKLSEEWVGQYLQGPHTRMPDMALTRKEAADIAAYIRAQSP